MLNTDSDPRCLTAAEKHQITSLMHEVPRPLPTSPLPAILPMGCLTSPPKADAQYFTIISYNQAQLLSRTNRVGEVIFHEGWSHSVSEEQQYSCSTVGGEIWDHNTLKLRQCVFNRAIKFKGSTKLYTCKAFQKALGTFSFGLPPVCLDSSVFKPLGSDFKAWISSIGLVT